MKKFPHFKQRDKMDCGPTCLKIIAKFYGRRFTAQRLRTLCQINKSGVNLLGLSEAATSIGFSSQGEMMGINALKEVNLPCILHWRDNHFVVLHKIEGNRYYISDPDHGRYRLSLEDFMEYWCNSVDKSMGILLTLNPLDYFYEQKTEDIQRIDWSWILSYLRDYRKLFVQLVLCLFVGTVIQLITPVLTQTVVDTGIPLKDLDFVYLVLFAQIMFFLGSSAVNLVRSWIMLHISTKFNMSILADFIAKLMRLPMSYFEVKTAGDIMQRMSDQQTIENFLTGTALSSVFSLINLAVFTIALWYYSGTIFLVSLFATIVYAGWILIFLGRRRDMNYKQFDLSSANQNNIVEMVNGIQEIKLNNFETEKRWDWERLQVKFFRFKVSNLIFNQYQSVGSSFINQGKNILITFLSVKAVITGELTIGGMMAIQYIVGQLGAPIEQIMSFVQSYQDAKISLERLNEVHSIPDEEFSAGTCVEQLPEDRTIVISDLSFRYPGAGNDYVLKDINMVIPAGMTTAIVGLSGSGKTTLLKLLLRFFEPESGNIRIGGVDFSRLSHHMWRSNCGTVLQDGFIFADTIARNITLGDNTSDPERLEKSIFLSNISDYISQSPYGLNTKIGAGGSNLSHGQRQRLLIARAIYKDPEYILFDEATNALDTTNEKVIMSNLDSFCKGKTVLVVAHRLSTVINADNIVLLDKGKIVEQGKHADLIALRGYYYTLIKNQLELGF